MRDREIAELVGANIRRCRTEHHWSLAELGERVGLDEATLSRIERAERGLDTVVLRRIADVFGKTMDEFFRAPADAPVAAYARPGEALREDLLQMIRWSEEVLRDLVYVKHEIKRLA